MAFKPNSKEKSIPIFYFEFPIMDVCYAVTSSKLLGFILYLFIVYSALSSPSGNGLAHCPHFENTTASHSISPMNLSHLQQ